MSQRATVPPGTTASATRSSAFSGIGRFFEGVEQWACGVHNHYCAYTVLTLLWAPIGFICCFVFSPIFCVVQFTTGVIVFSEAKVQDEKIRRPYHPAMNWVFAGTGLIGGLIAMHFKYGPLLIDLNKVVNEPALFVECIGVILSPVFYFMGKLLAFDQYAVKVKTAPRSSSRSSEAGIISRIGNAIGGAIGGSFSWIWSKRPKFLRRRVVLPAPPPPVPITESAAA